jgi:hypothetical protein
MTLINRYSRRSLNQDEVYTFSVVLCDNEVDRDLERFDIPTLRRLAELFVGVTGIIDHSMKSSDQKSRLFKTDFIQDFTRTTTAGEPYTFIKGTAYMVKSEKNADLIAEIDAGIKKEVSVSCSVSEILCSICNTEQKKGRCEHIKGERYGEKVCHRILSGAADAYEWSFVAVPAQRAAGVTKSFAPKKEEKCLEEILKALKEGKDEFMLRKAQMQALSGHISMLEKLAQDGKMYRSELEREVIRLGAVAMPYLSAENLEGMCKRLATDEVCALKKAFEAAAQKKIPLNPQLAADTRPLQNINQFKI